MHSLSAPKLPSTYASLVTKKIIIIKMNRHITNEGALTSSARVIFFRWRNSTGDRNLSLSLSFSHYLCVTGDMRGFKYKKKWLKEKESPWLRCRRRQNGASLWITIRRVAFTARSDSVFLLKRAADRNQETEEPRGDLGRGGKVWGGRGKK